MGRFVPEVIALGDRDLADHSRTDKLCGFADRGGRTTMQADLSNAQRRIDDLKGAAQADKAETQFASAAYDAVMANRLQGARIAVLFVGPVAGGRPRALPRLLRHQAFGSHRIHTRQTVDHRRACLGWVLPWAADSELMLACARPDAQCRST